MKEALKVPIEEVQTLANTIEDAEAAILDEMERINLPPVSIDEAKEAVKSARSLPAHAPSHLVDCTARCLLTPGSAIVPCNARIP